MASDGFSIALVCDDTLDNTDGVQQYTLTIGEWFRAQGYNVHYITSSTKRTDLKNLHVISKNVSRKFNGNRVGTPLPASPKAVKQLIAHHDFDIIHVQMPYSPILAGQVIQYAQKNTAIVGTFHIFPASKIVSIASRFLGFVMSHQLKRFDAVISVSEAARSFARETFRIESVIIPNAVDIDRFKVAAPPRKNTIEVVFLGRLVERKGCLQLLKAIVYMEAHVSPGVRYKVKIGGKGPLNDELKLYAHNHGLDDIVQFDGFIAEEDKVRYLAEADVAVFPSTGGESFGISLVEAMAATPGVVLAGDNPGYRSVLGKRPRQLFDPYDIETFAHVLSRSIASERERVDAHAWQLREVQQYDVAIIGARLLKIYRNSLRIRRS